MSNSSLETPFEKTKIRVLIVAEGDITFALDSPEPDKATGFSLIELIDKSLNPSAMPWEELTIIKAHRSSVIPGRNIGADIPDFKFDAPPAEHPLDSFDQIWLFGYEEELVGIDSHPNPLFLSPTELSALADFMNKGGGVFATGDHETLGAALCGNLPRVRSMRKWLAKDNPPSKFGLTRFDTLREGIDQGFNKSDQSDTIPQEIRPLFRLNKTDDGSQPHDLLKNRDLAIMVLPDHMHEGECLIPTALNETLTLSNGNPYMEYPPERGRTEKLLPDIVAVSTSVGGSVLDEEQPSPPVPPRLFNIIVAYDGHRAGKAAETYEKDYVGRVVVDSSFHHFLDINLRGTGSNKKGLYDDNNNPTRDYLAIKQYYRNIVLWLLPPEKQASYYMNMLRTVRRLSPLIEEIRPIKDPTLEELLFAGRATYQAISERFSRADAIKCALVAASTLSDALRAAAEEFLDPWRPVHEATVDPALMFINSDMLLKLILGGAMLGIAVELPSQPIVTPAPLAAAVAAAPVPQPPLLQNLIADGLKKTGAVLDKVIPQPHKPLGDFLNALK